MRRAARPLSARVRTVVWALALVWGAAAVAQTGAVEGTVADRETGESVVGAAVRIDAVGRAASLDGRFRFDAVAPGRQRLRVQALGYAALDTAVVVAPGRTLTLALRLSPTTLGVAEVVVQARRTETATRADAPVLLVPQAVSVVPRTVLLSQGARDARDALRSVPGATTNARGQPGAVPVLRGFETDQTGGGVRRNGVEIPYLSDGLHPNVERVEVLRGPASVLYGRLEPGGVVNFVTVKPTPERQTRLAAEAGSRASGRLTADVGGAVSPTVAARAVAEVERDVVRGDVRTDQAFASPSARWQPGAWTVDAEAEGVWQRAVLDPGLAALGPTTSATLDAVPDGRFFGEPSATHEWRGGGVYGAAAGPAGPVGLRVAASLSRHRLLRDQLDLNALVADGRVSRTLRREDLGFTYLKGAAFADARLRTGPVSHALTFGAEALRAWATADGRAGLRDTPDGLSFADIDPVSLADPSPTGLGSARDEVAYLDAGARGLDLGAFVQNRATLFVGDAAIHAVGSARLSHVRFGAEIVALADSPEAPAGLTNRTASVTVVTPAGGVVAQLRPGLALYASGGASFNPVVERVGRDGQPFRPVRGVQAETGVKAEGARLAATASAFWIRKDDALTTGPGGFAVQTGRQRSRGVEVELRGEPVPNLTVLATGALLDAVVTADSVVAVGTRLPYAPRWSASGWAEWRRGRLTLRGGAWAQGDRPGQLAGQVTLPAELVADVGAEVAVGDGLSVRLDVRNALDARGYSAARTRPGGGGEFLVVGWPTPGREIRLGLTLRR